MWYQSNFVEWAKAILHLEEVPDVYKHKPTQWGKWFGMTWSPYPFVTAVEVCTLLGLTGGVDKWWRMEDPMPMPASKSLLIPKWGAHLQATRFHGEGETTEEKEEMEESESSVETDVK